jgi:hypothetical protein
MKPFLLLTVLLLYGACAQAQHVHVSSTSTNLANGSGFGSWGGWDGYGTGGYGAGGYSSAGYGYGAGGFHHHAGLRYEPPREFSTGYFTNDGPYIPSTFMNYEDALALGRQQLAAAANPAQTDAGPSLGDVARAYRIARRSTQAPPALALQDNSGRLHICSLNGDNCRQP